MRGQRFVELALALQHDPTVVVCIRVIGIDPYGALVTGDCPLEPALVFQHKAEVIVRNSITGIDRDRLLVDAAGTDLAWSGWVGEPADIRARVEAAGEAGATELIYNPAGPDPLREIRAFAEATLP